MTSINLQGRIAYAPTSPQFRSPGKTPGSIVKGYKAAVTKKVRAEDKTCGQSMWQRNYYDHITRNKEQLSGIVRYIENNPQRWQFDKDNKAGIKDQKESDFREKYQF